MSIQSLVNNAVDLGRHSKFAAIIGLQPSKGARSPKLWNAAFAAHSIDCTMLALDVDEDNVVPLLQQLETDLRFMGGAVAMPYKVLVAKHLGTRIDPIARPIGTVNCLFRSENGEITGTNTDGAGALASFVAKFGDIGDRSIVLVGPGGAGKAVATYFSADIIKDHFTIVGRNDQSSLFATSLGVRYTDITSIADCLIDTDIFINCTSLGGTTSLNKSVLSEELIRRLPRHCIIFDIIYDPRPSLLLQQAQLRGLKTMDGLEMNLQQAVIAFMRAIPETKNLNSVLMSMTNAG